MMATPYNQFLPEFHRKDNILQGRVVFLVESLLSMVELRFPVNTGFLLLAIGAVLEPFKGAGEHPRSCKPVPRTAWGESATFTLGLAKKPAEQDSPCWSLRLPLEVKTHVLGQKELWPSWEWSCVREALTTEG